MARVYADVNAQFGKEWHDYNNSFIDWSSPDRYQIVRRLGGGKYSEVFEGIDMVKEDKCVLKVLKPVAETKIKREIKILRNVIGAPNVVGLLDVTRDPTGMYRSLVMEYVESTEWKQLYPVLTEHHIKRYMFQLLKALDFIHAHGIMHRDVKPGNIMFNHPQRELRLIDFGLAEFYHPGQEYHLRVGSRFYKPPELLVGYKRYDYSLDLWSLGCVFAAMIFRKEHFLRGSDNDDQLHKIMQTLGTEKFDTYLQKYAIPFETDRDMLLGEYPKKPWARWVSPDTVHLASQEALDLLDRLMRYDHAERPTAREAQAHVYFNSVRLEPPMAKEEALSDSGFYST